MKKIIILLLVLAVILSLTACGGTKFDPDSAIRKKVSNDVLVVCTVKYKDVKLVDTTLTTIENDGDTYNVKGKVVITDKFGDKYEGKVSGVYQLEGEEFKKVSLNIEDPKKK